MILLYLRVTVPSLQYFGLQMVNRNTRAAQTILTEWSLEGVNNCSPQKTQRHEIWIVVFWGVISCKLVGGYQCFGGKYRLYLQGNRNTVTCYKTARYHKPEIQHSIYLRLWKAQSSFLCKMLMKIWNVMLRNVTQGFWLGFFGTT